MGLGVYSIYRTTIYVRYSIIYFDLGCVGECVVTGLVTGVPRVSLGILLYTHTLHRRAQGLLRSPIELAIAHRTTKPDSKKHAVVSV